MKILYVGMRYDYGQPERGESFEQANFFSALQGMGHELIPFDFMQLETELGRSKMNDRLMETARREKPDLMFSILFRDEIAPLTLRTITDTGLPTLNWFCDDHWRFENFTRLYAPCFRWSITTAASALPKYAKLGYANVIASQWACNDTLYHKRDVPLTYDVTFVGQPHGNRRHVIDSLRNAGIAVQTWGNGWKNGRLTQEGMIDLFNRSRINLNLSNSSIPQLSWPAKAKRFAERVVYRTPVETQNARLQYGEQIKGRNFEVPGCGGFLLSGHAERLEEYYHIGQEIDCFNDTADLIEKVRYYLAHEAERATIAEAGHRRTLAEHTYRQRFDAAFARMGLR